MGVNKEMEIALRMMVGRRFTGEEAGKTARKEEDASISADERPSAKHQLLSSALRGVKVTDLKTKDKLYLLLKAPPQSEIHTC